MCFVFACDMNMKHIFIALLLAFCASSAMAENETRRGDINKDGTVTIADVTTLVIIILGKTPPDTDSPDIADDTPAWEPANAPRRHADDGLDGEGSRTAGKRTLKDSSVKTAKGSVKANHKN